MTARRALVAALVVAGHARHQLLTIAVRARRDPVDKRPCLRAAQRRGHASTVQYFDVAVGARAKREAEIAVVRGHVARTARISAIASTGASQITLENAGQRCCTLEIGRSRFAIHSLQEPG